MVQSSPPDELIISELFICSDCGAKTEQFVYHASDESYQYYDPDTESKRQGVKRAIKQNNITCRNCDSESVSPSNYDDL